MATYFPIFGGGRVTIAERIVTSLLEDDPDRNGRLLSEGLYRIVVSPIAAFYEINPAGSLVRVTSLGHFPV